MRASSLSAALVERGQGTPDPCLPIQAGPAVVGTRRASWLGWRIGRALDGEFVVSAVRAFPAALTESMPRAPSDCPRVDVRFSWIGPGARRVDGLASAAPPDPERRHRRTIHRQACGAARSLSSQSERAAPRRESRSPAIDEPTRLGDFIQPRRTTGSGYPIFKTDLRYRLRRSPRCGSESRRCLAVRRLGDRAGRRPISWFGVVLLI
jgi:hypothetical protein